MSSLISKIKQIISNLTNEIDQIPINAVLLDVRSPDEHERGVIESSILIPLADISNQHLVKQKIPDTSKPIVVYCEAGGRAMRAKKQLQAMGYEKVYNGGGIKGVKKLLNEH